MKTIKFIAFFILFFFLLSQTMTFAQESVLRVTGTSGTVLIKIYPSTEWKDATAGQELNQRDELKTGLDSKVALEFPDRSGITLKSNSEISIEELVWDNMAHKVGINMNSGELRTIIKKVNTPSEFKVKTPTAICGARGTIFYLRVLAYITSLFAGEGYVDFINTISNKSYTVVEGMMSISNIDGTISEPVRLSDPEIEGWLSGWEVGAVAEPYEPPVAGEEARTETIAPEVTPERTASDT